MPCVTSNVESPKVSVFEKYAIKVESIPPSQRNNRDVHHHYLNRLRDTLDTLCDIVKQTWKPTGKVFTIVGYHWKPTGRIFPLGAQCPLTRNTKNKVVPVKQWKPIGRLIPLGGQCPLVRPIALTRGTISADPHGNNTPVVQIVLWYLDSGCSKHMTGDRSRLRNFMRKFIRTFIFGNDHFGTIMGYGDYVIGDSVISRASKNKSWLWHRRLNHLNFDTLNDLAHKDLVRGLTRLKFEKDHLCSACQLGKNRKATYKPKTVNTIIEVLHYRSHCKGSQRPKKQKKETGTGIKTALEELPKVVNTARPNSAVVNAVREIRLIWLRPQHVSNSDDIQAAGSDTRPPMLDRTDYDSWSQRIWLPTRDTLGTTPEGGVLLGPERPHTYDDLNDNDMKRFDADVPKAIWNNVKMLLAGSELTKEERETQLYDEFERFKMLPGENINEYYVQFHKLINDMRNIKMTMPNIQLNSKFMNNMSLKWDRFVTAANQNKRNFVRGAGAEIGEHRIELGMPMQVKENQSSVITAMGLDISHKTVLSRSVHKILISSRTRYDQPVKDLAQNDDNIFQADECDAFDSDVDDEPTAQSIFRANLSQLGQQISKPDEPETYNEVQQKHVIDSNGADMGNSNVIPYEQYLTINEVFVEPSCASFVSNDVYVLHDNNAYIPHDPLVIKLNIYKQ
ncbi:retrovirus-related pol polyprotein from transposon TNT 1-94 [Tanacetum coccineum]